MKVTKAAFPNMVLPITQSAAKATSDLFAVIEGWENFPDDAEFELDVYQLARMQEHAERLAVLAEQFFADMARVFNEGTSS